MTTSRRLFLACGAAALLAPLALAEDKKDDKKAPAGTWKMKDGQTVIEFADKDTLKIHPQGDKENIAVECSYTASKDGVLKVTVTGHEGKDEIKKKLKEVLPVNTEFTFKWAVDGDTATIDSVEGKDVDGLKTHLEGKFEKK